MIFTSPFPPQLLPLGGTTVDNASISPYPYYAPLSDLLVIYELSLWSSLFPLPWQVHVQHPFPSIYQLK